MLIFLFPPLVSHLYFYCPLCLYFFNLSLLSPCFLSSLFPLHFLLTSLLIHHLILLVSSFSFSCIFFLLTFSSPSLFISLFLISLSFVIFLSLLSSFCLRFPFSFPSPFFSFALFSSLSSSFNLFCLFHSLIYCCVLFSWSFNALVFASSSPQCSRFWSHVPVHHRGCRLSRSVQTRDCAERQQYPSKQHHTGNK